MRGNRLWAVIAGMRAQKYVSALQPELPALIVLEETTPDSRTFSMCYNVTNASAETVSRCGGKATSDAPYEYLDETAAVRPLSCGNGSFLVPNVLHRHKDQSKYFDDLQLLGLKWTNNARIELSLLPPVCFPLKLRGTKHSDCASDNMPENAKDKRSHIMTKRRILRFWDVTLDVADTSLVLKVPQGCEGVENVSFPSVLMSLRKIGGAAMILSDTTRPQFYAYLSDVRFRHCVHATEDLGQTLKQCASITKGVGPYTYRLPIPSQKLVQCPNRHQYILPGILHRDAHQSEHFDSLTLSHFDFRDIVIGREPKEDMAAKTIDTCAPVFVASTEAEVCGEFRDATKLSPEDLKDDMNEVQIKVSSLRHKSVMIWVKNGCPNLEGKEFPKAILTFQRKQKPETTETETRGKQKPEVTKLTPTEALATRNYVRLGALFGASSASLLIIAATILFY